MKFNKVLFEFKFDYIIITKHKKDLKMGKQINQEELFAEFNDLHIAENETLDDNELANKIVTSMLDGTYIDHAQGGSLLRIDLEDLVLSVMKGKIAELVGKEMRIQYLERVEKGLCDENTLLRTELTRSELERSMLR